MGMKKRIFIFGIFSLCVNMNFLASAPQSQKYKIYILGDTKVGKSCIYNRYIADTFIERYLSTISVAYTTKKLESYKYTLFDSTGDIEYMSTALKMVKNVDCFLLVYDVTSRKSFNNLPKWLELINEEIKKNAIFVVVGNTIDLKEQRTVSTDEGKAFAKNNGFIFAEVSAKTGEGIKDLFENQIYSKINEKINQGGGEYK
jgi:small GTP-binding protein